MRKPQKIFTMNNQTFRSTSYSLSTIHDSLELVCATRWAPHTHTHTHIHTNIQYLPYIHTLASQYLPQVCQQHTHAHTRWQREQIGTPLSWGGREMSMFYIPPQDKQFNTQSEGGSPHTQSTHTEWGGVLHTHTEWGGLSTHTLPYHYPKHTHTTLAQPQTHTHCLTQCTLLPYWNKHVM